MNGGVATTGYQRVYPGDSVVLSVDPAAVLGVGLQALKFQITDFPGALAEPSGWTTAAGIYRYEGATSAPAFTIPATYAEAFGKYPLRFQINNGTPTAGRDHSTAFARWPR